MKTKTGKELDALKDVTTAIATMTLAHTDMIAILDERLDKLEQLLDKLRTYFVEEDNDA